MDHRSVRTTPLPADLGAAVRETKKTLQVRLGDPAAALAEVAHDLRREVAAVASDRDAGLEVVPVVRFADVARGRVP